MVAAMKWLVSGARAGDHLFLHYSGHGSQTEDTDGDELDGKDEAASRVCGVGTSPGCEFGFDVGEWRLGRSTIESRRTFQAC